MLAVGSLRIAPETMRSVWHVFVPGEWAGSQELRKDYGSFLMYLFRAPAAGYMAGVALEK